MRETPPLAQTLRDALAGSIEALVQGCPPLLNDAPLFRRLSDLKTNLESGRAEPTASPSARPSLSECLQLTDSTYQMLTTLRNWENSGASWEAMSALDQVLTRLKTDLAAARRKEQAYRVRGLYVIIDPEVTGGREPLVVATAAVRGGARMLQLRDKLRDKGESLPLAAALQALCEANDVLLIINDHLDLAIAVGSGGVHVGQTDLPVAEARRVLAPHQVLGRSNREFEQLVESQEMGADHLAFGPIYPTDTKAIVRQPQGIERLKQARAVARVPLVAIGGINLDNVAPVVAAGADAICVTAAVGAAPDPEAAASRMVEAIQAAGGKV
ncbi:MAG: thiamine phosphate synthase [Chloroflexi bacterium]|nr:thiamine phosphate synthase [Chloroflexota bacterium]